MGVSWRSKHLRCSTIKAALKNFSNFTGKHLCWILFLIKLQAPTQVLYCEIWEIYKYTYFKEYLLTVTSGPAEKLV